MCQGRYDAGAAATASLGGDRPQHVKAGRTPRGDHRGEHPHQQREHQEDHQLPERDADPLEPLVTQGIHQRHAEDDAQADAEDRAEHRDHH